ncbi:MAG: threonine/serine dehydratase [Alphaproteobacteria bacterium]
MTSSPGTEAEIAPHALPGHGDVVEAAARLEGLAVATPVLEAEGLNAVVGGRVLVKCEMLQRTGSFKFRGAYNRISRLSADERRRGVIAYSSGNHAQGVAAAAALIGAPATIVMPRDAPAVKLAGTRRLGAEVVLYDRASESREEIGERLMADKGATLVRPYDDFHVIAGQGTVGLELGRQLAEIGVTPDAVLCPCGGGGLIAGVALALERALPGVPLWAVEPQGFDDTARSLALGRRVANREGGTSICDALVIPIPGELTFALNAKRLAGGLAVDDAEVRRAMALSLRHLKVVAEPGGAVALAALIAGRFDGRGKTVAVIASGGNVDPALLAEALAAD